MPDTGINQQIERLQKRREFPEEGVVAAIVLGRAGKILRTELETPPRHLGPGDADNAVSALTLALWDSSVTPTQRQAAAWALAQIGGPQPMRKLLNRLQSLFAPGGQAATNAERATLVAALVHAVDMPTIPALSPFDRQQLYQTVQALLAYLQSEADLDPDLSTAIAMGLARLVIRAPALMPRNTMQRLTRSEPTATLAGVGALSELISAEERDAVLSDWSRGVPNATLTAALQRLDESCGQPCEPERLLSLFARFGPADGEVELASESLWKNVQQGFPETDLSLA